MEKEFSDLKKSVDPNINLKSSDSKSPSEDLNGETYSFIVDEKADDNIDDLNITKTFGTNLPSLKDASSKELPSRKSLMDFKPAKDDSTVRTYIL